MAVLVYHTGRSASVDLFLKLRVLKLFMPDLTIILHDFPWPIINFYHFTGLENDILDFQVFSEPNKPCLCNLVHVHASLGQKKKLFMTVAFNTECIKKAIRPSHLQQQLVQYITLIMNLHSPGFSFTPNNSVLKHTAP